MRTDAKLLGIVLKRFVVVHLLLRLFIVCLQFSDIVIDHLNCFESRVAEIYIFVIMVTENSQVFMYMVVPVLYLYTFSHAQCCNSGDRKWFPKRIFSWDIFVYVLPGWLRNSSAVHNCCANLRVRLSDTPLKLVLRSRSYKLYDNSSNTRHRWFRHIKWHFSFTET